ncbi:DUF5685 family protein [Streptomyces johnsoniae]|uniref:DUF5685 family protein n=1 Tax=Streptomyces johnsoniae TaxID=3075532 RepID=A0ABU2S6Z7_9ACTN|nr:DUF5685 family protein [Streptomyces sp. DSM 41886]MDT0444199.1 DUF5685 family protein [Streptomyces sp. DSM 41886]
MFGIIRPCRHRLPGGLADDWVAHLCGLCLALRGTHGQAARVATNYDGLLISVLHEAQAPKAPAARRTAGPCPLRGMRTASVARGEGAALAAAVSLVLASAKIRDHVADRDGLLARRGVAAAARRFATGWDAAGSRGGARIGFDTAVLTDAVDRQQEVEAAAGPGTPVLAVTEPTETATAAAFAHTAHLAGRPDNATPLAEAGRLFGRIAHLLDAVEDLAADERNGAWNPVAATGTPLPEVRRLCDDAALGIRLALAEAHFDDDRLLHLLLDHELRRAVDRTFDTSCAHLPPGGAPPPTRRRGLLVGCAVWTGLFCTGQVCCSDPYRDPWTGRKRTGWCRRGNCCEACSEGCQCCNCGGDGANRGGRGNDSGAGGGDAGGGSSGGGGGRGGGGDASSGGDGCGCCCDC